MRKFRKPKPLRASKLVKQKARALLGSPKPSRPLETRKHTPPKHRKSIQSMDFDD